MRLELAAATRLFPLWAVAVSFAAYAAPSLFTPLASSLSILLGAVMLGMGLTLTAESFRRVLERPRVVLAGIAMQFLFMPLLAGGVASALALPPQIAAGVVLVGSCPGGTASNVITYLARGAVALSITLTAVSTLLSVAATPFLTWLLVGRSVPVPAGSMLQSILAVVVLPVLAGVAINTYWGPQLRKVQRVFPLISVAAIVVIIAVVVALNRDQLASVGGTVLLAVVLHNLLGLACGYAAARALRFDETECRTLAIEVGMQNSGLGVVLATRYFSPVAALPGAVFSIWHNLSGSILAAYWSRDGARAAALTPCLSREREPRRRRAAPP